MAFNQGQFCNIWSYFWLSQPETIGMLLLDRDWVAVQHLPQQGIIWPQMPTVPRWRNPALIKVREGRKTQNEHEHSSHFPPLTRAHSLLPSAKALIYNPMCTWNIPEDRPSPTKNMPHLLFKIHQVASVLRYTLSPHFYISENGMWPIISFPQKAVIKSMETFMNNYILDQRNMVV